MATERPAAPAPHDETIDLLERARGGDRQALDALFARHLPLLRRWASGRLPRWARDITDTTDVVQETLIATLRRIEHFEPRGEGAFQAYLRQAVINRIRNQIQRAIAKKPAETLGPDLEAPGTSPLEAAIGRQLEDRYEKALAKLDPDEREAIVTRVEFGMTFPEVAEVLDKPSPDAARMAVVRALVRLAEEMNRAG